MKQQTLSPTSGRIQYLDGIRGVASMLVIFCHLANTFGNRLYTVSENSTIAEKIWIGSPLNILTNGNIAVQIFFVLSGFLIAKRIYEKRENVGVSPGKSYVKFVRIILPAVMLSYLLMRLGLMFHLKASALNPSFSFTDTYNNFAPSLKKVFTESFIWIFFYNSSYVGPFWCIKYEFLGGILVSCLACCAAANRKISKPIYLTALVFFFLMPHSEFGNFAAFVFGALAADCLPATEPDNSILGKGIRYLLNHKISFVLLFALGIYCGSVCIEPVGIYRLFSFYVGKGFSPVFIRSFGVALSLLCVTRCPKIQAFFSWKPFLWLGSISAYTYGFHWPIILSVGCGTYVLLYGRMNDQIIYAISSILSIAVSLGLAFGYTKLLPILRKGESRIDDKIRTLFKKKA